MSGYGPHSDQKSVRDRNNRGFLGQPAGPERGDKVGGTCDHCRDRHTYFQGDVPHGRTKYCPECFERYEQFDDVTQMRIADEVRSNIKWLIRDHTGYDVWADQHPKRLVLFDPDEVDFDLIRWREIDDE